MLRESKRNNLAQHYYIRSVLKKLFLSFAFTPYAEDNKFINHVPNFSCRANKKIMSFQHKERIEYIEP